ncbi:phosphonoacetaldehyde hydrolase [Paraburkholderia sp. Ac-20340]|uniref:phosphonoacetaldehyde hydrolase n=1 Tax=Paraburkholderia sp. Ac-20340 TaxID=2703888 RepID=UPI00197E18C8|nr:phosphonoacetaldehyde hydrolase [Paraburkholderia sp. Ac-20340]MBN3852046.1 phosphonoacetaldehyde hydrolase [Paraburkholderia sp. Ac-20340]
MTTSLNVHSLHDAAEARVRNPRRPAPYQGRLTTAIFDWAGTVLDFGCIAPVEAFCEAFALAQLPITVAEARAPMGAAKREHIALILRDESVQARWQAQFGRASNEDDIDTLYASFLRIDEVNVAKYSALIPGALETIAALRARGIAIGSTTGYPREVMKNLQPIAAAHGYAPDFCCTVSDVARGRPWPDMCLANALALGAAHVQSCVVVDDSPTGLEAGLAAGMWTVGIVATGNEVGLSLAQWQALDAAAREALLAPAREKLARTGAHFLIDSIAELPAVIDAIERSMAAGEAA